MSPNVIDPRQTAPYRLYVWANENLDTHKAAHGLSRPRLRRAMRR